MEVGGGTIPPRLTQCWKGWQFRSLLRWLLGGRRRRRRPRRSTIGRWVHGAREIYILGGKFRYAILELEALDLQETFVVLRSKMEEELKYRNTLFLDHKEKRNIFPCKAAVANCANISWLNLDGCAGKLIFRPMHKEPAKKSRAHWYPAPKKRVGRIIFCIWEIAVPPHRQKWWFSPPQLFIFFGGFESQARPRWKLLFS